MRSAKKRRAKDGKKNLGGDTGKMKKSLKQKGTALFVVVLFMAMMLVPAVSAMMLPPESADKQGYTATKERPSNFRVYSIEQGDTATVKKPANFRVYAKKYDTPQRGKAEINPTEIKESINASFTISFKGTEQKFGHAIYLKDGEEVHEIVPYVPSTSIKVTGDSIDDFPASISLDKVGNVPDIFVVITESDLDKYPILRNILEELERFEGAGGINYKTGEIKGNEIVNLVQCKYAKKYDTPQGYYIKYKEDFYSIWLMILLVSAGEGR